MLVIIEKIAHSLELYKWYIKKKFMKELSHISFHVIHNRYCKLDLYLLHKLDMRIVSQSEPLKDAQE